MNKNAKGRPRLKDGPQVGVHFRLPPAQLRELNSLGEATRLSKSQLIRLGVRGVVAALGEEPASDQQHTD
ncbi:MAG: hypothetical protein IH953_00570 [Chloroflexi bacterium]|nr:hypothetical protein [Chloroflexota bacterium]